MFNAMLVNSTDINLWAERLDSRSQLPRLIRRLIYATCSDIKQIAFAADEGVQLGGWDGTVISLQGNSSIPAGVSGWEIGATKDIKGKADDDYEKRDQGPLGVNQAEATYIFVTPRRWGGKDRWLEERNAENIWREVRAYDAEDLSQWLEQAPGVHIWLSELIGKYPRGAQSLDLFWSNWAGETTPPFTPDLVIGGRTDAEKSILDWLNGPPSALSLQADSTEEAIAFLAAVIQNLQSVERETVMARAVIAEETGAWHDLAPSQAPLILIPRFNQPEGINRIIQHGHHVFIPSGIIGNKETLVLPRLQRDAAEAALKTMGMRDNQARDMATLARRSLSALRRKQSLVPSVQKPAWAQPNEARFLLALLLAGVWQDTSEGDQAAVSEMAAVPYEEIQRMVVRWANEVDPPFRRVGDVWMVVAREDAWRLIAHYLTDSDLSRFESTTLKILGERDPALDLPQEKRFASSIHGKNLTHSGHLRNGIAETLALMATLSPDVKFASSRTGEDVAQRIVWLLLDRAKDNIDLWASISSYLPLLAEASPKVFLDAVDSASAGDQPLLLQIFQDKQSETIWGVSSPHTGLLWALETLAWCPEHFSRAILMLARLVCLDPGGRLGNRPANSLRDIFLCWHPQTNVPLQRRLATLDMLRKRENAVAWQLLISLLPRNHSTVSLNNKAKWRDWGPTSPEAVTWKEYLEATDAVLERLVSDATANATRWHDLIEACGELAAHQRSTFLQALERVAPEQFSSEEIAQVRDSLRKQIEHHRGFPDATWVMPTEDIERLEKIYDQFAPSDPVIRDRWLFNRYVRVPGLKRGEWKETAEVVDNLRTTAVREIILTRGWEGLLKLAAEAEDANVIGAILSRTALLPLDIDHFLMENLAKATVWRRQLVNGYVSASSNTEGDTWIDTRLNAATGKWTTAQYGDFLLALPFSMNILDRLDIMDVETQQYYWNHVSHISFPETPNDAARLLSSMLQFGRVHVAVEAVEWALTRTPDLFQPERIAELLEVAIQTSPAADFNSSSFAHNSADLLSHLEKTDLPRERLALIEWMYINVHQYYRSPTLLHCELSRSPELFVELLKQIFRERNAPDKDLPAPETEEYKLSAARAERALDALESWKQLPGQNDDGSIDANTLSDWVVKVRELTTACDRREIGDTYIGKQLAFSPSDADGDWPHRAIRDLVEEIASPDIEHGWQVQIHNSRGVTWRSPTDGGVQERALATKYATYAEHLRDEWPRTAAALQSVADDYLREASQEDQRADLTQDFWT